MNSDCSVFAQARASVTEALFDVNSHRIGILCLNVGALIMFSYLVMNLNQAHLLHGLDGHYMRLLIEQEYIWMPVGWALTNNPFQGMGNVFFPFNMSLVPAFLIPALLSDGHALPVFSFVIFAAEIFYTTYLLGRIARLHLTPVLIASWLMVILALPFFWPPLFNSTYALVPNCIDMIVGQSILFWAVASIGTTNQFMTVAGFCLLMVVPGYLVASNPLVVVVIAPTVTLGFVCFLASSETQKVFTLRLAATILCVVMLGVGGFIEYWLGNTQYTVPAFFSDELMRHQDRLYYASLLFQSDSFSVASPALVLLSAPGAAIVAISGRGSSRALAVLHLVLMSLAVCGGYVIVTYLHGWRGPQMSYFEMSIWPTYCLFATVTIWTVVSALTVGVKTGLSQLRVFHSPVHWRTANFPGRRMMERLALMSVSVLVLFRVAIALGSSEVESAYPPSGTKIVRTLQTEVGLSPGSIYRGSVATFTGTNTSDGVSWFEQHANDAILTSIYNNDHRLVGLWAYGIPTLAEYNHYITPPMYLVLSRLMARPIDRQMRNIVVTTVVNVNLLRNFGVRYVITDTKLDQGPVLRETLGGTKGVKVLYLYELSSPNLGNYSPVRAVKVGDALQALAALKQGVDFETQVVTTEELPDNLVPATTASLTFDQGQMRIKAKSSGVSLLVLPIQYSHCLQSVSSAVLPADARLIRANLVQVGVVFSGNLDLVLHFRTGPFGNARCRLQDVEDAKVLNIQGAAHGFPLTAASH